MGEIQFSQHILICYLDYLLYLYILFYRIIYLYIQLVNSYLKIISYGEEAM